MTARKVRAVGLEWPPELERFTKSLSRTDDLFEGEDRFTLTVACSNCHKTATFKMWQPYDARVRWAMAFIAAHAKCKPGPGETKAPWPSLAFTLPLDK